MKTLQAYKGDAKLKEDFLCEIENHRKQDQIVQKTYGEGSGKNWRGCAVGCSVHSLNKLKGTKYQTSNHKVYETELGIPEWLAWLEDTVFEGLPVELAKKWPGQFAKAIPVGANLEPVKWQFCAYLMKENIDRVLSLDISDKLKEQVIKAIRDVLSVHETAIKTGNFDESAAWSAAESARSAAWSAAESARSAAWSAAWSARSAAESAGSAAWSAAWSAWSAAWSAGSAAESAGSAAGSAAYVKHSKKLISLLKKANPQPNKGDNDE